jgi:hypothetical protein
MRKLLLLLLCAPLFLLGQNTFIKQFTNSKWVNGSDKLNFLEVLDNKENTYKAVTSSSYIFYIDLDKDNYSTKELNPERIQCCMCSYKSILDTKDSLIVDHFSTDDFGNSELRVNTFYIQENKLVQVEVIDNESPIVTIWSQVSSEIENIKFKNKRYYSNSYTNLLFREEPNVNSKVLNRIKYGDELTVTDGPLTKHDLTFNFSTNFKANYKSINYNTHTIESYYVKANYKGINGYVYFGLLSEKKPIDFSMFFEVSTIQNTGEGYLIFKDQDTTMMISEEYIYEEYIDKDAGNLINSKRIKTYQNNIIIIEEDNEKTRIDIIELTIDSRDDFYILSNNLLRYLNSHTFEDLNISKDSLSISFSEMGASIWIIISEDEKKVYIKYDYGGC